MFARNARLPLSPLLLTAGIGFGAAWAQDAKEMPVVKDRHPSWTGSVSEEQFKAMHELETGEVQDLHGQMIELAGGHAYLSLPANAKPPLPGIVVIQEWWGLNEHIKLWTDRLAADGYAAIAVDLYGGTVATTPDVAR